MRVDMELDYPPSVNHYWCQSGKRRYIGAKGLAFRSHVFDVCSRLPRLSGRLKASIYVYPPDRRKRDIDNILKSALDSLQHGLMFADDEQIDRLYVERREVVKGGKLVVILEEIKNG